MHVDRVKPTGARVLMASRRLEQPWVSRTSAYELEDVVQTIDSVDFVVPPLTSPRALPLEARVLSRLEAHAKLELTRLPRLVKTPISGQYDLFFLYSMGVPSPEFLAALPGWRKRCRVAVCWIEELWLRLLKYKKMLEPLREFDFVFVECEHTVGALADIIGRPCEFLPAGVDALRFCPFPNPPERSIDLYNMGRRSERTHHALLEHAKNNDFFYVYDTLSFRDFYGDPSSHRELLASYSKRSKFFMANRAKVNEPSHTEGQQEVGTRFFEGTAGGAIVVGDPPLGATFTNLFDWPDAIVPVEFGATDIVERLSDFASNEERVQRARENNVKNALLRHDWVYRWEQILARAGLAPTALSEHRRQRLAERAKRIGHAQDVEPASVRLA